MKSKIQVTPPKLQKFARSGIRAQVIIHNEEHLFIAPIENISAGGVFIDQLVAIPFGSRVRIVIKSPQLQKPIQAIGTVVRIENQTRRGMAIEFLAISQESRHTIQSYVLDTNSEQELRVA